MSILTLTNFIVICRDTNKMISKEFIQSLISISELDALKKIRSFGFRGRISRRDKITYNLSRDVRLDRISLDIANGVVLFAIIG